MDLRTFIIAYALGFGGILFFTLILNLPEAGTLLAIAYIGGKIYYILQHKE